MDSLSHCLGHPVALQMDLGTVGVETHPQPAQSLAPMEHNYVLEV